MFLIRFPFYFAFSFLILSIPISGKPVFDHLTLSISPIVHSTVSKLKSWGQGALKDTKAITSKAINNIKPEQDEVKSSLSATKSDKIEDSGQENYTQEEKELLLKILNESEK
ncbi:MAG: hypothetical protein Fur0010_04160 [Bdellovibrio sp.]